ncbi:DUF805 domain-containing protein [Flavobacterium franklandianum]|uniref:DUF805 domain-containing protein n=1 Tax=Flavobacterium franklandianum TaxID=2594430 RepID=A0A553CT92_9FLAO|nr:DUF805 domain-containing protein [Flavobacterium franklandianum]TRX23614.1 DUF805 domain-containing protein [Flavobacterium franklandianum]
MIEWYKKVVFENYANFNGRARRSEYWYFTLANIIVCIIAMIIDKVAGLNFEPLPYGWLYLANSLLVIVPGLAVTVRRLHDLGKSGWFFFIILIPLIGSIWLLVLFCTEGDQGTNSYGPDPKNEFDEIEEIGTIEA